MFFSEGKAQTFLVFPEYSEERYHTVFDQPNKSKIFEFHLLVVENFRICCVKLFARNSEMFT